MSGNLIIGSSHALYLGRATGTYLTTLDEWKTMEEAQDKLIRIESFSGKDNHLLYTMPKPAFVTLYQTPENTIRATFEAPIDEIRAYNRKSSKVVFMLGGNEPAGRFFYRNSKPFDFFHPEVPETDTSRQLLPLAHMGSIIADLLRNAALATEALAHELPLARKYCVATPPPIPSEEHIRKFPEIFDFKKYAIEDRFVRLKLYRLQMQYMAEFCARIGLEFIPPPASTVDAQGFLREDYWLGCTHASAGYYKDIVAALAL